MPNPSMDATMAAIAKAIYDRDHGDVDALRNQTVQMQYAGHTWPIDQEAFSKGPSKLDIMRGLDAQKRLNQNGELNELSKYAGGKVGEGISPEEGEATQQHLLQLYLQTLGKR